MTSDEAAPRHERFDWTVMLTKDLGIAQYDFHHQRIVPDRLTTREHAHYVDFARRMLVTYRQGTGQTRRNLHREVRDIFADEPACPQRRIDAFCKLLDDQSEYSQAGRRDAPKLRRNVFQLAASKHPLVMRPDQLFEHATHDVREEIARQIGRPWFDIERDLFADVMEFNRMERFVGYPDGRSLLSRYNVAQVQVALFSCVSLNVWATNDFKRILRAARLAKLMHTIRRTSHGRYHIRLDGPASVVRETRRYGVAMARFLPALLACRGWRMHAVVETRSRWKLSLDLSDADGLQSHLPPDKQFDSEVEAAFFEKWGTEPREGWLLQREGDILHHDQKTFVPDFVCRHEAGRTVFLEIVGFWTPEYLESRLATHRLFPDAPILLAVQESLSHHFEPTTSNDRLIRFKSRLLIKPVMEALVKFTE